MPGAAQDNQAHLADLVRRGDQDRYWSALLAPQPARDDLLALYAFNAELARIPEQVSEPQLGEIRLQWWSEALDAALGGDVPDHPVLIALKQALYRQGLGTALLQEMIEARRVDLYGDLFPDFAELDSYIARTAGAVFRLGAQILGGPAALPADLADPAARAYALTGLLRALPTHASRGRLFLPQTLLAKHGLHPDAILAGVHSPDLAAALRDLRDRASAALAEFRSAAAAVPRQVRPAFLPLALTRPYLRRLASASHDPLREVVEINPLRRYALIWQSFLSGRF